jgi:hypothetical protein
LIGKLADKIIFGIALIIALQVPQLADHYQQFLSGLYESTKWQVDGYEATAKQHEYPDLRVMIEHHLQNNDASVRTDAAQKLYTLELYDELTNGVIVFQEGNLLDKAVYMFNPARYGNLEITLSNFKLGIPLTLNGIAFGVIVGLLINYIITLPFILWTRRKNHLISD